MLPDLLATFAPYLLAYSDISVTYNGNTIKPEDQIETQTEIEINFEETGKQPIKGKIKAIHWKQSFISKIYFCGGSGVVYDEQDYTLLKNNATSVYLLSEYFEKMHRENTLEMGAADPVYEYFQDEARKYAKEFTQKQEIDDAAAEIQRIKDEGAYP